MKDWKIDNIEKLLMDPKMFKMKYKKNEAVDEWYYLSGQSIEENDFFNELTQKIKDNSEISEFSEEIEKRIQYKKKILTDEYVKNHFEYLQDYILYRCDLYDYSFALDVFSDRYVIITTKTPIHSDRIFLRLYDRYSYASFSKFKRLRLFLRNYYYSLKYMPRSK